MSEPLNIPQRRRRSIKPMLIGLVIAVPVLVSVSVITAYYHSKALQKAQPAIDATSRFILLAGSGQVASAKAMCGDQISEQQLTDTAVAFEPWGAILDVDKMYGGQVNSDSDIEVQALIKFEKASKIFVGHWDVTQSPLKLVSYNFKDAPTTQPAKK